MSASRCHITSITEAHRGKSQVCVFANAILNRERARCCLLRYRTSPCNCVQSREAGGRWWTPTNAPGRRVTSVTNMSVTRDAGGYSVGFQGISGYQRAAKPFSRHVSYLRVCGAACACVALRCLRVRHVALPARVSRCAACACVASRRAACVCVALRCLRLFRAALPARAPRYLRVRHAA